MHSSDNSLGAGHMFDNVIEAYDIEMVSFVIHLLEWLSLDREISSHVFRDLSGNLNPFGVRPTLFGGGLKESAKPAPDIQDVARGVIRKIFRCFRLQSLFPASVTFSFDQSLETAGTGGK
jgi:hypothetical protein